MCTRAVVCIFLRGVRTVPAQPGSLANLHCSDLGRRWPCRAAEPGSQDHPVGPEPVQCGGWLHPLQGSRAGLGTVPTPTSLLYLLTSLQTHPQEAVVAGISGPLSTWGLGWTLIGLIDLRPRLAHRFPPRFSCFLSLVSALLPLSSSCSLRPDSLWSPTSLRRNLGRTWPCCPFQSTEEPSRSLLFSLYSLIVHKPAAPSSGVWGFFRYWCVI